MCGDLCPFLCVQIVSSSPFTRPLTGGSSKKTKDKWGNITVSGRVEGLWSNSMRYVYRERERGRERELHEICRGKEVSL